MFSASYTSFLLSCGRTRTLRTVWPAQQFATTAHTGMTGNTNTTPDTTDNKHRHSQRPTLSLSQRICRILNEPNNKYLSKTQLYDALQSNTYTDAQQTTDSTEQNQPDTTVDILKPRSQQHLGRILSHLRQQHRIRVVPPTAEELHTGPEPYVHMNTLNVADRKNQARRLVTLQANNSFMYTLIDPAQRKQENIEKMQKRQEYRILNKQKLYDAHIRRFPNAAIGDAVELQYVEKQPSKYRTYAERHGYSGIETPQHTTQAATV